MKVFDQRLVDVKVSKKNIRFPVFLLLLKDFGQLLIEVTVLRRKVSLVIFLCGFHSTNC
jgi:hypothetical protein